MDELLMPTTTEECLNRMEDLLNKAVSLPLMGGKCVVDTEELRELVEEIRVNLPTEIRQAKIIANDRVQIISKAKQDAEITLRVAEEAKKRMLSQDEIIKAAQIKANEILEAAQQRSKEMRAATNQYVDNLLREHENALGQDLAAIKKLRSNLRHDGQ